MRILFLGDIVGRTGRQAVKRVLPGVREELAADLILANGENASGGVGLTAKNARELLDAGVDVLTGGNHTFRHRDLYPLLDSSARLLRPGNYPDASPGRGLTVVPTAGGANVAVASLLGRLFMDADPVDDPFAALSSMLASLEAQGLDAAAVVVDFHAEATSEKLAMGRYFDGRIAALIGTHTHVQTNDFQVLARGTAYVTDAGMCGARDSIIGFTAGPVVRRYTTGLPERFKVAGGACLLDGVLLEVDVTTGHAVSISPWRRLVS
jgi:metallophosphoesterase (TIGR00282 family)